MTEPKKGATVVIVEGADKGTQGVLLAVYRQYDYDTQTVGKRVKIRVTEQNGDIERIIKTRLSWVREI